MKINKLIIQRHLMESLVIDFNTHTFITSIENSLGKTTLIRFILFALGYNIPSTKNVDMKDFPVSLYITNNELDYVIKRYNDAITLEFPDSSVQSFNLELESDLSTIHSIVFNSTNYSLLNNILTICYIDQDTGWTLLNKGKSITDFNFTIQDFICSFSQVDINKQKEEIKEIDKEKNKYKALKNILKIKEDSRITENNTNPAKVEELNILQLKKASLQNEVRLSSNKLEQLNKTLLDNSKMVDYILSQDLLLKVNDQEFLLEEKNIVNFNFNQYILKSQINDETCKKNTIEANIRTIDRQLKEYNKLFSLEDQASQIIRSINETSLDCLKIQKVVDQLSVQKTTIVESINKIAKNQEICSKLRQYIESFAKQLGVYEKLLENENDYLFTKNKKAYSGTILHKIVFCFRLSFNLLASEYLNINLPFIVDSPGSAEMKLKGIKDMIQLIKNNDPNKQVIISSVYRELVELYNDSKEIYLDEYLFY